MVKVREEPRPSGAPHKGRRASRAAKGLKGKTPQSCWRFGRRREALCHRRRRRRGGFVGCGQRLFNGCNHEAFHAYLNTFVHPANGGRSRTGSTRGWRRIYETAIVEGGELRVGPPKRTGRGTSPGGREGRKLRPWADLLRSAPRHVSGPRAPISKGLGRNYLASWALGVHMTLEKSP